METADIITQFRKGNSLRDIPNNRIVKFQAADPSMNFIWVNWNNGKGIYTLDPDEFEILPITEQWLTDAGWKSYEGENYCETEHVRTGREHRTRVAYNIGWKYLIVGDLQISNFYHIHRLQNLWLDIFNEELIFNR